MIDNFLLELRKTKMLANENEKRRYVTTAGFR